MKKSGIKRYKVATILIMIFIVYKIIQGCNLRMAKNCFDRRDQFTKAKSNLSHFQYDRIKKRIKYF